jgi:putative DNA primase/helicase
MSMALSIHRRLRRDGSLLSVPGYDRATGLWYKPPLNFSLPPIVPDKLTIDDAKKALECDCRAMTIYVNGNNVHVVGALGRRTITCSMNANEERPELREFKHEPVKEALAQRAELLAAIFTIAMAHRAAGCPTPERKPVAIAGFEEWSRWVQWPLMWLGCADPMASQEDVRAFDPDWVALCARNEALIKYAGDLGDTYCIADIHRLATEQRIDANGHHGFRRQDLFDAFTRDGKNISTASITKQITKDRGRRIGEYHIERVRKDARTHSTYQMFKGKDPYKAVTQPKTPEQEGGVM